MAANNFQTIQTQDQTLNRIQANISNSLNKISGPFIGGNLLTSVSISPAPTVIAHKLGRVPQIWVVCDQNTLTELKRISWDANSITLESGADCIVSLWVN